VVSFFHSVRIARVLALAVAVSCSCAVHFAAARPDDPARDSVGLIDGDAISVSGPMSVEVVHGQTKTVLLSGSDVRVKSGTAKINLVEGGQIIICGPAHLSLLKSGGSLTVALDTGTIHARIEREPALTIYTAELQAQPVPIGDGPRDLLVGFETSGAMCIRANRGAVRLEQQLTGQSVMVPQAGDVLLTNGQIDSLHTNAGRCACELPVVQPTPPPQPEISQLLTAEEVRKTASNAVRKAPPVSDTNPTTNDEPIYQVLMPPLVYDAKAKAQPEIDPKLIVLVRRARVRPALIFRGHVEGEVVTAAAVSPAPAPAPAGSAKSPKPTPPANDSFFDRLRSFIRKLWSRRA
jgi:hypothetical protein